MFNDGTIAKYRYIGLDAIDIWNQSNGFFMEKEAEISFTDGTIVVVPMKNLLFYGIAKSKKEKRKVLEYSQKAMKIV